MLTQTDQLQIRRTMTDSEARCQAILDSAQDAILLTDAHAFRILDANRTAQEWFGYNLEQLQGLDILTLSKTTHLHTLEEFRERLQTMRSEGNLQHKIIPLLCSDKHEKWVEIRLIPTHIENQEAFLLMIRDISPQLEMEAAQKKLTQYYSKMEKAATLSAMSAGIIHEIGQPLNAMTLMVDSMMFSYHRKGYVDQNRMLQVLQDMGDELERINRIIKHIYSLTNTSTLSESIPYDLNEIVTRALDVLSTQLAEHSITITFALSSTPLIIQGDPTGMEGVIINLLVNAMAELDESTQSNKKICCATAREDKQICLEISDNGRGIPDAIIDLIFEPFFTTRGPEKGMGIGLAVVQTVITRMGGQIDVSNDPSGGASFKVLLPELEVYDANPTR